MRELVIIIPDLYLPPPEAAQPKTLATAMLPALAHTARFGRKSPLECDWRPWLARWLHRDDLARAAPATLIAASASHHITDTPPSAPDAPPAAPSAASASHRVTDIPPDAPTTTWLATPLHLIASLTSLHLDPRSILHVSPDERAALADDFNRAFADSRFRLESVDSGVLLMHARGTVNAATTEPARALAGDLEASLPHGPDAATLKRLGAELEMWLHAHPLNDARARRGELPINTLWLWGGPTPGHHEHPADLPASANATAAAPSDLLFGSDPYLTALLRAHGSTAHALPDRLPDLRAHAEIQRMALVAAITPLLHTNPQWTLFEALADLEHRFLSPALTELRRGTLATLVLIANDTQLRIERRDRLKFWRRSPQSALDPLRSI